MIIKQITKLGFFDEEETKYRFFKASFEQILVDGVQLTFLDKEL